MHDFTLQIYELVPFISALILDRGTRSRTRWSCANWKYNERNLHFKKQIKKHLRYPSYWKRLNFSLDHSVSGRLPVEIAGGVSVEALHTEFRSGTGPCRLQGGITARYVRLFLAAESAAMEVVRATFGATPLAASVERPAEFLAELACHQKQHSVSRNIWAMGLDTCWNE